MANIDKIRIVDEIQGTTQDYGFGATASQDDIELPIDYNTVYDEDEHQVGYYKVTGGYKPLYRRTRELGTLSSGGNKSFNLLIDNLDKITDVRLLRYNSTTVGSIPAVSTDTYEVANQIGFWIIKGDPNMITISNGTDRSDFTAVMTIEYTKTTDTIVEEIPQQTIPSYVRTYLDTVPVGTELEYSGQTVPEGYEEVEDEGDVYSTEERRIGTWIDGKPLYRKVINITTPSAPNTWGNVAQISNLSNLASINGYVNLTASLFKAPLPYYESSSYNMTIVVYDNGNIAMKVSSEAYTSISGIIIAEYTKTTDQGGNS